MPDEQAQDDALRQVAAQFSLEADVLYLLAKKRQNFVTEADWQEAKAKVNALNPGKFTF